MTASAPMPHGRAFELLPWLVNGTLDAAEREAVEEHARACITCRRELKEQQQLQVALRARRTADVSAEGGFARLDSELDRPNRLLRRPARIRYATAAPFALAAAAGVAVLAVLVWFTPLPELGNADYSTLATTPAADGGALVDIVFTDDTTAAEIRQLLEDIEGEIVAGPSDLGRYSVRLTHTGGQAHEVGELLTSLSADPRVRFAGRALTDVEP
jgi:anti-sigma factor RsiW